MTFIVMAAALFAGAILKDLTPIWISMGHAEAPFILCIVIYYALNRSKELMLLAATTGGILCDSLGGLPFGTSVFSLYIVSAITYKYRELMFSSGWASHMFFGAMAGIGYSLMLYIILSIAEPVIREAPLSWVAAKIMGMSAFSAIIMPLVFKSMLALDKTMGNIIVMDSE